ncbi:RIMS-binding protein 2, partial [Armadillidium nasatum]
FGLNQQRIGTASHCTYLDLEDIAEEEESPLGDNANGIISELILANEWSLQPFKTICFDAAILSYSVPKIWSGAQRKAKTVPPPVQLTLERQLNKSILIGWNPPPDCPPGTIESYHVYVNGLLKTTVKATERTRALVEGVDSTKLHRISVRSVTPNRRTSRDAACTMVIGKDCPVGPTSVRATNITSTSAVISWMPSNSNFQHTVCVNSVEVRTVKPGVYRHTITGLSPNTIYRVSIRAKNLRAPQFDEKSSLFQERLSAGIEFRTLPKDIQILSHSCLNRSSEQNNRTLTHLYRSTSANPYSQNLSLGRNRFVSCKEVSENK